jgi:hypothetical protein
MIHPVFMIGFFMEMGNPETFLMMQKKGTRGGRMFQRVSMRQSMNSSDRRMHGIFF